MSKNWFKRLKKTDPDLPYETPFWFGDYSNGELYHEATEKERRTRELILKLGAEKARRYGMDRREFMASGLGVMLCMSVVNAVNECDGSGGGFGVPDAGTDADPVQCETALNYTDIFIFDIQTHRVETAPQQYALFLSFLPQSFCGKGTLGCFTRDEYARKLFLESDTTVSVLSGVPATDGNNPLTNEQIADTRDYVNGLAQETQRVRTHVMVLPNYNQAQQFEGMQRLVETRSPVGAWKCYTPWGPGGTNTGWWLDDPLIGIPFIQKGRSLGIKTFCCHKGLPLPGFNNAYGDPKDIGVVAKLFPDTNFIVYHSAYQYGGSNENIPYTTGSVSGVNSLVTACLNNGIGPGQNVFGELGTTWYSVMNNPQAATHVLGKLLKYLGENNIVWGSDCIWYGSPQPQIIAFMNFRMDPFIRDTYGYPDLTLDRKRKILGANAARAYGIDPNATLCGIRATQLAQHKRDLDEEFGRHRWVFNNKPLLRTRKDFDLHTAFNKAANQPG